MVQRVSITITCSDQIGLLATITGRLFDLNADLGNTNFSVRKKIAEFNSVAEFKNLLDEKVIVLELNKLPGLENAQINISEYHPTIKKENQLQITYSVELRGEDRPGLVARMAEVFAEFESNIVTMNSQVISQHGNPDYLIRFGVYIPHIRAQSCIAAIDNTAKSLGLACQYDKVDVK
ncbi:MAG: amino acid-binding protein [Alphaproteobacteria bacterium]|nr:amino acid-binding protein [Alphaproteobacteria bacterium]|tara:strand:+ start:2042 stop:2575 length:534 start_codon:yes stop_codon:yes gene_type:complete